MAEKRKNKRSAIELAASFGIEEDLRPERNAKIKNASSGGFCFASDSKVRIGERIQLAVDLDTKDEAIITVKVVWAKKDEKSGKYLVGVQIDEREGPGFDRFIDYCNDAL